MKQILILFLSISSLIVFGQNRSSLQPDSVYKSLHVKMRIGVTNSRWAGAGNKVETFDKNGRITELFDFSKFSPTTPRYQEAFFYDSLGRVQQQIHKGVVNTDFSRKSISKLITLYNYDLSGYLKTEMAYDTTGRIRIEVIYDYKLGVKTRYYYDSAGNRKMENENFFDGSMNFFKSCSHWFTDTSNNCTHWKNEFDKLGRIKKCSVIEKNNNFALIYKYKPNGLLSAVETQGGGILNGTERFTYEYW